MPVFKTVKIHPDYHAEVVKALYSLPEQWIGATLDVRADSELVKFYHRGKLVKSILASLSVAAAPTARICRNTRPATRYVTWRR